MIPSVLGPWKRELLEDGETVWQRRIGNDIERRYYDGRKLIIQDAYQPVFENLSAKFYEMASAAATVQCTYCGTWRPARARCESCGGS